MDAPKAKTFRGQLFIWILGGIGAGALAIAGLVITHVLSWYDPPDQTDVVLAQNAALIESLTLAISQKVQPASASQPQVTVTPTQPVSSSPQMAVAGGIEPVSSTAPAETSAAVASMALPAPAATDSGSVAQASAVRPPSSEVLVADLSQPVHTDDVLPPAATRVDIQSSANAKPAPAVDVQPETIGVFEGDRFSICGHSDFSARLSSGGGKTQIVFSSNDRSIPGRTFRGFERSLDPRVPDVFWPGCRVAADFTAAASTTRIVVSILGDKQ